MFRWGILSTAKIAREHLIPAIITADNATLQAIASRDLGKARALADQFGAPLAFGSYDELLASPEVDGVYIPLPTSQHVEWAIRAADAGKHVLVEKPLSLDAGAIDDVIAARNRNGVLVCEAFMVTYHPQWLKVRDLLAEGAIGTLRRVQGAFSYFNVDPQNMRNRTDLGGGALPDIGVYPTVVTRFATGQEPTRVRADIERDPAFGTDVHVSVQAFFGAFDLSFYLSTQLAARQFMTFHGDKGFIEVKTPFNAGLYGDDVVELHNHSHDAMQAFRFPATNQYRLQVEAFVRRAQGGGDPVFTLENSVKNQRVIDAAFRSGASGGWETV